MTEPDETLIDGPIRARLLAEAVCGMTTFADLTVDERRLAFTLLAVSSARRAEEADMDDGEVRGTVAVLNPDTGTLNLLHADGTVEAVEVEEDDQ